MENLLNTIYSSNLKFQKPIGWWHCLFDRRNLKTSKAQVKMSKILRFPGLRGTQNPCQVALILLSLSRNQRYATVPPGFPNLVLQSCVLLRGGGGSLISASVAFRAPPPPFQKVGCVTLAILPSFSVMGFPRIITKKVAAAFCTTKPPG